MFRITTSPAGYSNSTTRPAVITHRPSCSCMRRSRGSGMPSRIAATAADIPLSYQSFKKYAQECPDKTACHRPMAVLSPEIWASWTRELSVRPVLPGERTRYQELLAGHHWLGPRLFGSVIRHVAVLDGGWVALLGYGSAVLRCTARDQVIGWPDGDRVDRLPMLAGNQRFCMLPDTPRRPHLASAVLARSLARLPADYLRFHNQIVLAVETFTDPARHTGACYAAAGFACAGSTRGYARRAGGSGYAFHGQVKRCWLREVAPGGLAALGAVVPSVLFTPPPPAVWLDLG